MCGGSWLLDVQSVWRGPVDLMTVIGYGVVKAGFYCLCLGFWGMIHSLQTIYSFVFHNFSLSGESLGQSRMVQKRAACFYMSEVEFVFACSDRMTYFCDRTVEWRSERNSLSLRVGGVRR